MTNDFILLSVAFGPKYIEQQYRLTGSIMQIYPDASLTFWYDGYPYGSKTHHESLYGFKVHAVKSALSEGYKKIIWLDTACILQRPVDYWFTLDKPVLAARDDNKLKELVSGKALKHFGHEQCPEHLHLVGGSVYVWNFEHPDCQKIFDTWADTEEKGLFGAAGERLGGHRHDESLLALSMNIHGYGPISCAEMMYNSGPESIIIKKHFK